MRGTVVETNVLARALMFVGDVRPKYHLAYPNGGSNPQSAFPWDRETGGCDCIGFAAWCAGFDRFQPKFPLYGGWVNTDSMVQEARTAGKWFTVLEKPENGCFIVAESFRRKLPPFNRVIGHIGVVVDAAGYDAHGLDGVGVVHCSSGNMRKYGKAIWKTTGSVWKGYPKALFVRFNREYAQGLR